jgi:hypothetical protein
MTPKRTEMNDAEIAILDLWKAGLSASQTGKKLGKTKNAVIGAIYRLRKRGVDVSRAESNVLAMRPPRMKRIAAPVERDRSIMALTAFTCRYPFGDARKEGVTYCCETVERPGFDVYCRKHALACYVQRLAS